MILIEDLPMQKVLSRVKHNTSDLDELWLQHDMMFKSYVCLLSFTCGVRAGVGMPGVLVAV